MFIINELFVGQPDSQFEVYVSAMLDPSRFWLQIVGPKATELDQLVEEMTDYYSKQDNRDLHILNTIECGDLVAAIFKFDGKWYLFCIFCRFIKLKLFLGIELKCLI